MHETDLCMDKWECESPLRYCAHAREANCSIQVLSSQKKKVSYKTKSFITENNIHVQLRLC